MTLEATWNRKEQLKQLTNGITDNLKIELTGPTEITVSFRHEYSGREARYVSDLYIRTRENDGTLVDAPLVAKAPTLQDGINMLFNAVADIGDNQRLVLVNKTEAGGRRDVEVHYRKVDGRFQACPHDGFRKQPALLAVG